MGTVSTLTRFFSLPGGPPGTPPRAVPPPPPGDAAAVVCGGRFLYDEDAGTLLLRCVLGGMPTWMSYTLGDDGGGPRRRCVTMFFPGAELVPGGVANHVVMEDVALPTGGWWGETPGNRADGGPKAGGGVGVGVGCPPRGLGGCCGGEGGGGGAAGGRLSRGGEGGGGHV